MKKHELIKKLTAVSVSALVAVSTVGLVGCKDDDNAKSTSSEYTSTTSQTKDPGDIKSKVNTGSNTPSTTTEQVAEPRVENYDFLQSIDTEGAKNVNVTMTDGQEFTITVYPKVAPITADNFLSLVSSGFYDGLTFHRIIDGFMAQGGDPLGNGTGGSDKEIKGEFKSNGYDNPLPHMRGVVSMARSMAPDSASSQFFICYEDTPYLDGEYATFGCVTQGMEVVDSFLSAGTDASDRPLKEVRIQTMKIAE